MGDDIVSVLALFFGGPTAFGRLLILTGLALALVNCFRFLVARPAVALAADGAAPTVRHEGGARFLRGAGPALFGPPVLVLLGACSATFLITPWYVITAAPLFAAVVVAVRRLRAEHGRRGEDAVAGPVLAVVLSTTTLVLVGVIMTVRLVVQPDPTSGFADSDRGTVTDVVFSLAIPLLGLLGLMWWERLRVVDRLPWRPRKPVLLYWIGIGAVVLLFVAPLLDLNRNDNLAFFGIATPEYGKVLYIWVLAVVLARYAIGFQVRPGALRWRPSVARLRRAAAKGKHVGYIFLMFGLVGVAGLIKTDIGPTIPTFFATVTIVVFLLRLQVRSGTRLLDTLNSSRSLWAALLLTGLIAYFVLQLDYVKTRQEAWHQPWTFGWSTPCAPPPEGVEPPKAPDGTTACLESLDAVAAGKRSQVAQSMSAVADGGVWGRGLSDTGAGRLPAGSTDFILAVLWNKLGGFAVVLLALLLAVLAAALARCRSHLDKFADERADLPGADRQSRAARLFAVGVAGMLVGQFGFVFVTTLNVVPHSGITVPFLSRGGHSTLALVGAVVAAVWLLYRADRPPRPKAATEARTAVVRTAPMGGMWLPKVRRVLPLTFVAMFVGTTLLATTITIAPYGRYAQDRPYCPVTRVRVDPEVCSTDRIANRRTRVELRVGGEPVYVRDRSEQAWQAVGTPAVTLSDLAGLIRLNGRGGTLNNTLDDLIDRASGTSLKERVLPTPGGPEAGLIDLTVDPALQRSLTGALRADAEESKPLAGGIVVMDAKTGRVLAASSAPSALDWPVVEPVEADKKAVEAFGDDHTVYGPIENGKVVTTGDDCDDTDWDDRCRRWILETAPTTPNPKALEEQRRYAPDTPDEVLPSLDENRALDRRYGLGSTFKVVVAAAFLKNRPGSTAQSTIPSPTVYQPPFGKPIRNYNKGACQGTANERITLKQALTVSCNTAFVALADELGWDAVRDMAVEMGFADLSAQGADDAWLAGPAAGSASYVPPSVDTDGMDSLGNNTLGGGRVEGTAVQMATMMTAVANEGRVVQPTLVAATAEPFGRDQVRYSGEVREVLPSGQARELAEALSGVTQNDDGTAHRLKAEPDRALRVKTGTHEIYGEDETPPDKRFAKQNAWVVGSLDTKAGPVTFAVVVETKVEKDGSRRAQWLTQQVIDKVVEVRG
ncbi:hypothetical protein GCM10022243_54590 [Saccharothrix violaceirubra]|uniref:Beta-lactamase n=1 Tax=Saccharothrix violaceirubra TaxID=413306 RepID=A0A7W7T6K5_9PSEU|nr:penicillin-binding transpeptidase domain-containing protein [Saccharothrix violaceirubra]MBB4966972.1 cell division protein FtsI/penicillin-binding protein 2/cell division protein FtsW (lipid II flippase) [Saccharothrix violaceirubra]